MDLKTNETHSYMLILCWYDIVSNIKQDKKW